MPHPGETASAARAPPSVGEFLDQSEATLQPELLQQQVQFQRLAVRRVMLVLVNQIVPEVVHERVAAQVATADQRLERGGVEFGSQFIIKNALRQLGLSKKDFTDWI